MTMMIAMRVFCACVAHGHMDMNGRMLCAVTRRSWVCGCVLRAVLVVCVCVVWCVCCGCHERLQSAHDGSTLGHGAFVGHMRVCGGRRIGESECRMGGLCGRTQGQDVGRSLRLRTGPSEKREHFLLSRFCSFVPTFAVGTAAAGPRQHAKS